jgi:hypothetical protein
MNFIKRFSVSLDTVGVVGMVSIPSNATEVAFRVIDKYITPDPPPAPEITLVCMVDDTQPADRMVTRYFAMVPDGQALPANFVKYVAMVPFGPDKGLVDIIEVSSAS